MSGGYEIGSLRGVLPNADIARPDPCDTIARPVPRQQRGFAVDVTRTSDGVQTHESDLQPARKLYEDFAAGDIQAILESLHPQIEWYEAEGNPYQPDGRPFRGSQEIVEKLFAPLGQEWDSFTVTPRVFHECDRGVVVMEGRYTGVFTKTGRRLDCQVCHVLTYEGGKLLRFQQYVDTAQFRSVMGV